MWKRCGPSLKISSGFTVQLRSLAWQRSCLDVTLLTSPSHPDKTVSPDIYDHTIWAWHDTGCTNVHLRLIQIWMWPCFAEMLTADFLFWQVGCKTVVTRLPKEVLARRCVWIPPHNHDDSVDKLINDINDFPRLLMDSATGGVLSAVCLFAFAKLLIYECENSHALFVLQTVAQHWITPPVPLLPIYCWSFVQYQHMVLPIFSIYFKFLPEKPVDCVAHHTSAFLLHFFPNMSSFFLQVSNGSLRRNILAVSQQSASVSIYRRGISGVRHFQCHKCTCITLRSRLYVS